MLLDGPKKKVGLTLSMGSIDYERIIRELLGANCKLDIGRMHICAFVSNAFCKKETLYL